MQDDREQHADDHAGGEVAALQHEVERLRALLEEREDALEASRDRIEHDLLCARCELAQARIEQERLAEQLSAVQASSAPPAVAPERHGQRRNRRSWRAWLSPSLRRMQHDRELLEREAQRLRQSGLFDADWYLAEYPDVANTGIDPAEHYLLHGAPEGRNPGPEFNTHQYLFEHPDLVDSSENPLLHYLRSGQASQTR